jgi:hypothetical protein
MCSAKSSALDQLNRDEVIITSHNAIATPLAVNARRADRLK